MTHTSSLQRDPNKDSCVRISPKSQKQPRILVVDDHEWNNLVTGTYLENFGFDYDIATSGREALDKVKTRHYDAILMDIQMPVMDGLETTTRIRRFEREMGRRRQPVIALTAHHFIGGRVNCLESGMDSFLTKPFSPMTLRDMLTGFIGNLCDK